MYLTVMELHLDAPAKGITVYLRMIGSGVCVCVCVCVWGGGGGGGRGSWQPHLTFPCFP